MSIGKLWRWLLRPPPASEHAVVMQALDEAAGPDAAVRYWHTRHEPPIGDVGGWPT